VDFGPKRLVWPKAYGLRHGYSSGSNFLRNWVLEGSVDGQHWCLLSEHSEDKGLIDTGYAAHTWMLEKPPPASGLRYLRVKQTGRNSSHAFDLYLSGFEVYGRLLNSLHRVQVETPDWHPKQPQKKGRRKLMPNLA
jgi:hypothetical protein